MPPGAARSRGRSPAQAPEAEAILAEILALRKIVINLLYGELTGEPLDEGRMRELIEAADSEKLAKAHERLRSVLAAARAGALSDDERGGGAGAQRDGAPAGGVTI